MTPEEIDQIAEAVVAKLKALEEPVKLTPKQKRKKEEEERWRAHVRKFLMKKHTLKL